MITELVVGRYVGNNGIVPGGRRPRHQLLLIDRPVLLPPCVKMMVSDDMLLADPRHFPRSPAPHRAVTASAIPPRAGRVVASRLERAGSRRSMAPIAWLQPGHGASLVHATLVALLKQTSALLTSAPGAGRRVIRASTGDPVGDGGNSLQIGYLQSWLRSPNAPAPPNRRCTGGGRASQSSARSPAALTVGCGR